MKLLIFIFGLTAGAIGHYYILTPSIAVVEIEGPSLPERLRDKIFL
jgi:hypothetical protein